MELQRTRAELTAAQRRLTAMEAEKASLSIGRREARRSAEPAGCTDNLHAGAFPRATFFTHRHAAPRLRDRQATRIMEDRLGRTEEHYAELRQAMSEVSRLAAAAMAAAHEVPTAVPVAVATNPAAAAASTPSRFQLRIAQQQAAAGATAESQDRSAEQGRLAAAAAPVPASSAATSAEDAAEAVPRWVKRLPWPRGPLLLGGRSFRNAAAVWAFCTALLAEDKARLGGAEGSRRAQRDWLLQPADAAVMVDLLRRGHPSAAEKLGGSDGGGLGVKIGDHAQYADSRCFFVVHADGRAADFSYRACMQGLGPGSAGWDAAAAEPETLTPSAEGNNSARVIVTKAAAAAAAAATDVVATGLGGGALRSAASL